MLSAVQKLVEPAKILIVIGIAYTVAMTGWYFVSEPAPPAAGNAAGPAGSRGVSSAGDVERIAARDLFGEAGRLPESPTPVEAPQTALRLTLEGVFEADDASRSAAIVAERGGDGELYLIGDALPGNATLEEVHRDRIVLRRGNGYETLRFDEAAPLDARTGSDDGSDALPDAAQLPDPAGFERLAQGDFGAVRRRSRDERGGADDHDAMRDALEAYRERLEADPERALDELGVVAVAQDGAQGYRLGALAEEPALREAGLQPDDVVLSVNGEPVGNIMRDLNRFNTDTLLSQDEVRVEVQRDDRRFTVTRSLR